MFFRKKKRKTHLQECTPYPFLIFSQLANRPALCVKMHASFHARMALLRTVFSYPRGTATHLLYLLLVACSRLCCCFLLPLPAVAAGLPAAAL
jgi:hypothetical protein